MPFGALIALPQDRWVLSCSPELFVRHHAGRLVTRPMKGTAPRHPDDATADRNSADWLARDPKNRAENLMIVDLLRNDLGRLATVEADLPPATDLPAVLRAVFPCGSIIGRLESSPRGLYTGAIGWVEAPGVHRLRLDLSHDGRTTCRSGALAALLDGSLPLLGPRGRVPVAASALLGHKTSLLVKLGGRWHTPPRSAGLLPGVMRAELMADPHWEVTERVLCPVALAGAEALAVCNALRGVRFAHLQCA